MKDVKDSLDQHVLIVTGPERERLYAHFSALFAGREGVSVLMDRRVTERRRELPGSTTRERRTGDRRRRRPDWIVPPPEGM